MTRSKPGRATRRALCLCACVTLAACDSATGPASPEDALTLARESLESRDYDAFVDCLTDESAEEWAVGAVFMGLMSRGLAEMSEGDTGAKGAAKLSAALDGHGLTEDAVRQLRESGDSEEGARSGPERLLSIVDDPRGLVADVLGALGDAEAADFARPLQGELQNLEVREDRATGRCVRRTGTRWAKTGRTEILDLEFHEEGGRWLLQLGSNQIPKVEVAPEQIVTVKYAIDHIDWVDRPHSMEILGMLRRDASYEGALVPDDPSSSAAQRSLDDTTPLVLRFGPVDDVAAFASEWKYGEVTRTEGRTVLVKGIGSRELRSREFGSRELRSRPRRSN